MDGLSAAASGIAVVSLAIQLVDSVREIQRFLRDVSDAPKELKRLLELLNLLEFTIEKIGMLMEKQRQNSKDYDSGSDVSEIVLRAMKMCESKLSMLQSVVETAKKASLSESKARKSLGSLRLACKKRDIEDFENQLQHAVSILDLAMTMNLT